MAEPIVIVDEKGAEHEFPAGFDPKRAAAIVRSSGFTDTSFPMGPQPNHGVITDDPPQAPGLMERLNTALQPLAHPKTLSDFASLLIPDGAGMRGMPGFSKIQPSATPANATSTAFKPTPIPQGGWSMPPRTPTAGPSTAPAAEGAEDIGTLFQQRYGRPLGAGSRTILEQGRPPTTPTPAPPTQGNLALKPQPEMRAAPLSVTELAEAGRRMYGSEDAGKMLYPNLPTAQGQATIQRLAPGPSQLPLRAETAMLDQNYGRLIDDPRGLMMPGLAQVMDRWGVPGVLGALVGGPVAHHAGMPFSYGMLAGGAAGAATPAALASGGRMAVRGSQWLATPEGQAALRAAVMAHLGENVATQPPDERR